ncbi:N-acetylmuramoyl-L-alanine amidase [Croceitalea dokdonensis DOKDO 023]|uniref:N-acetylmuramoyl-L-alanine amidase n=1 Tax=Croceitalea dokdonensis DOKDO 023 TaxID=1300341 RepID=A0A0P7ARD6_9FLAO|nr:N-acetylmuramoyl-L-alanine amidase [Croceitalea dokdonensis]KPM30379.1 N-acetylmuramoyl-L-alanine amidase [Croceitalea dokdonensis DOKDO 023]
MTQNKLVVLAVIIVSLVSLAFVEVGPQPLNPKKFIVVLDAGHGGHDPGNLGNGYLEKDIALDIVLEIGKELGKDPDIKVIYTRKDDTFIDLFRRGEIANQANADLFVSVHCDSHNSDAHGAGTFVLGLHANEQNFEVAKKENSVIYLEDNYEEKYAEYNINSPESVIGLTVMQEEFLDQSIQLAKLMQDNFTKNLKRKDRKVKQAGFIVLHQTFMPSVLVETGFLTNKSEGSYLNSDKGKKAMGAAIADAIIKYKNGVVVQANPVPTVVEKSKDIPRPVQEKGMESIAKKEESKVVDPPLKNTEKTVAKVVEPVQKQPEPKVDDVLFKVQLMASGKVIALVPSNFKGLDQLSKEPVNKLFRYMYGATTSYDNAKSLKAKANSKGYAGAYIVAYKNGVRIPLKEALK